MKTDIVRTYIVIVSAPEVGMRETFEINGYLAAWYFFRSMRKMKTEQGNVVLMDGETCEIIADTEWDEE